VSDEDHGSMDMDRTHVSRKSCEAEYNNTVGTVGTKEDQVAFLVSRVSQIPQL
jgi:hypothetical protein